MSKGAFYRAFSKAVETATGRHRLLWGYRRGGTPREATEVAINKEDHVWLEASEFMLRKAITKQIGATVNWDSTCLHVKELLKNRKLLMLSFFCPLNVCLNQFHLSNCCETGETASGVVFYIFSQCTIILVAENENLNRLMEVKKNLPSLLYCGYIAKIQNKGFQISSVAFP